MIWMLTSGSLSLTGLLAFAVVLSISASPLAAQSAQSDESALFQDLKWRNIGPANMAGRVTDIEAVESDFTTVYVAAASGGVWKSVNAGTTWEAIFEGYGTANVGDIVSARLRW